MTTCLTIFKAGLLGDSSTQRTLYQFFRAKKFISPCTERIKRDDLADLMDYLSNSDFYTSPASTRFHLSEPGGLLAHSLNVYDELRRLLTAYPENIG